MTDKEKDEAIKQLMVKVVNLEKQIQYHKKALEKLQNPPKKIDPEGEFFKAYAKRKPNGR